MFLQNKMGVLHKISKFEPHLLIKKWVYVLLSDEYTPNMVYKGFGNSVEYWKPLKSPEFSVLKTLRLPLVASLYQGLILPVRLINNSDRSIRGTERAPLLSMPLSSSCFKVSIQNKEQNLHSLPFVCIATAFSKYHSGKHALSYVPLLSQISEVDSMSVGISTN